MAGQSKDSGGQQLPRASSKYINVDNIICLVDTIVMGNWVPKVYNLSILEGGVIVQELCESRGGRPGLSVLTSLLVSVDVKIYCTVLRHWSQLVPNMSHDI